MHAWLQMLDAKELARVQREVIDDGACLKPAGPVHCTTLMGALAQPLHMNHHYPRILPCQTQNSMMGPS